MAITREATRDELHHVKGRDPPLWLRVFALTSKAPCSTRTRTSPYGTPPMPRKVWLPVIAAAVVVAVVVPLALTHNGKHPDPHWAATVTAIQPRAAATAPVTFGIYQMTFTPDQALAATAPMTAQQVWTALGAPGSIPATETPQFGTLTHVVSTAGGGATDVWRDRPVWAFASPSACDITEAPGYRGSLPVVPTGLACTSWIFADPTTGAQIAELEQDPSLDNDVSSSATPTS